MFLNSTGTYRRALAYHESSLQSIIYADLASVEGMKFSFMTGKVYGEFIKSFNR